MKKKIFIESLEGIEHGGYTNMHDNDEPVTWLWYHMIAEAELKLLCADGAGGKGTLISSLQAMLSRGGQLPNDNTIREPMNTILLCEEETFTKHISPRLKAMRADPTCIKVFTKETLAAAGPKIGLNLKEGEAFDLTKNMDVLEALIESWDAKLCIIDPLGDYARVPDFNSNSQTRNLLVPLANMSQHTGCATLCVQHTNKDGNKTGGDRIMGSSGQKNTARHVIGLSDIGNGVRLAKVIKSNDAPMGCGHKFKIVTAEPYMNKGKVITTRKIEMLEAVEYSDLPRPKSLSDYCTEAIYKILDEAGGPMKRVQIIEEVEKVAAKDPNAPAGKVSSTVDQCFGKMGNELASLGKGEYVLKIHMEAKEVA